MNLTYVPIILLSLIIFGLLWLLINIEWTKKEREINDSKVMEKYKKMFER